MLPSTRAGESLPPAVQGTTSPLKAILALAIVVQLLALLVSPVFAQSDKELGAYLDLVNRFKANGDVLELERYVSTAPGGYLRTNALELLAWQYRKIGDRERAVKWANELAAARPDNAIALALMADTEHDLTQTSPADAGGENRLSMAKRALRGIDQLQPIEGMSGDEFAALKKDLSRSLNGAVGYAYFQRNDYVTARGYLRRSVALAPDSAQYVYALAIADLYGNPPEKAEGYRLLAQSVNMNKGTPSGQELATFARQRYKEEGGKDEDWDMYLTNSPAPPRSEPVVLAEANPPASAPTPTTPVTPTTAPASTAPVTSAPSSTPTAPATSTTTAAASTASMASATAPIPAAITTSTPTNTGGVTGSTTAQPSIQGGGIASGPPSSAATRTDTRKVEPPKPEPKQDMAERIRRAEENVEIASAKTSPLPPRPPRKIEPTGSPVSMGILIETAATSRDTRQNVVNTLSDLVRHLREPDEAFVVSFSNDVVFEQDLTNNPEVLKKAMDSIKPTQGTALFDAVAFAAGHLNRVARNSKKVLIVVSDGSNHTNRISPLELSGELNVSGVEIYCIGLGAETTEDQYRLQALAQRTGGRTVFTAGREQFRAATQQVAQTLGIPF
jgi:tetratricopeptide (TPR) repeat protein